MRFEKTGSYYKKPTLTKLFLSIKAQLIAVRIFILCLIDYRESIVANDFTLLDCWGLCQAQGDCQIGRTLTMVNEGVEEAEK